jgi:NAD(P)-dependent dehydrogenase (short-subunit alcohol dehydrogenase family)
VAKAFAREGATVHLAGRTRATLEKVANSIDGETRVAVVDAMDEAAVEAHADQVVADSGAIDVSFNLIAHPYTHGVPLVEMEVDDLMAPVETAARSTFITARAAGRRMLARRSGVILAFGGSADRRGPDRDYLLGGTQIAFDAIETLRRAFSVELGPHGIRFVTLVSGGVPDTFPSGMEEAAEIRKMIEGTTFTGRAAGLDDVGNAAVFAASDWARSMTAATVNISAGAIVD